MKFAIIGATGNVGRKTIDILEKSNLDIKELYLVASKNSLGKKIKFKGNELNVVALDNFDFEKADITFFAAGSSIAEKYAKKASQKTIVIDNSKFFRMDKDVPLIVPEVNSEDIKKHKNIIANPNCSTIQMVLALNPLHQKFNIKRVVVSTYQAVSGAGKAAMDELMSQTKDFLEKKKIKSKNFTKQIAFNLIPHIDVFVEDGYTKEEWKMENETKKILSENIKVSATCVRVPVITSHSESVNVEFEKNYNINEVKKLLSETSGCKLVDEHVDGGYITPLEAQDDLKTYISRVRKDRSNEKAINMWIVSDNLLKGAALNSVQIAETLVKYGIK
jgi:aspartate-semialdehyde dehydrogenase